MTYKNMLLMCTLSPGNWEYIPPNQGNRKTGDPERKESNRERRAIPKQQKENPGILSAGL